MVLMNKQQLHATYVCCIYVTWKENLSVLTSVVGVGICSL